MKKCTIKGLYPKFNKLVKQKCLDLISKQEISYVAYNYVANIHNKIISNKKGCR